MTWRDYPRPTIHGLFFVTALTGPGDPRWKGKPDRDTIIRILTLTETDSRGQRFHYSRGSLRRLDTPEEFAALNRAIHFTTYRNTNYPAQDCVIKQSRPKI